MLFSRPISQAFLRSIISLLLVVMAWNGPVPVLHSHGTCLNGLVLHRHVEKFHSGTKNSDHPVAHWHFAFVDELVGDLLPGSFCSHLPTPAVLAESEELGHRRGHALSDLRCSTDWFACRAQHARLTGIGILFEFTHQAFPGGAPMIAVTGVCQI